MNETEIVLPLIGIDVVVAEATMPGANLRVGVVAVLALGLIRVIVMVGVAVEDDLVHEELSVVIVLGLHLVEQVAGVDEIGRNSFPTASSTSHWTGRPRGRC